MGCGNRARLTKFTNESDLVRVASFNIRVGKYSSGSQLAGPIAVKWSSPCWPTHATMSLVFRSLDFQIAEIHQRLPRYEVYAIGRSSQQDTGETCAILFRKDRFCKIDSGTLWFSSTPWEPGSKFMGTLFPASAVGFVWQILKRHAVFMCTIFIWTTCRKNPDPKAPKSWPSRSPCENIPNLLS